MKKNSLLLSCFALAVSLAACSGNDSASTATSDSTTTNTTTMASDSNGSTMAPADTSTTSATAPATSASTTPLGKADSTFVMKAAIGGLTEVESSKVAQQNAQNERVKAYADMMVNDHTKANSELATLASSRGITLPTSLPADKQKHVDDMKAMKGEGFDSHYVSMMVNDHKKDVAEFEKQSASGQDPELKAWAAKTLPVLKTHRDSIMAISKAKM